MPFPFFPGGLLLALAVLGAVMVLFGLALRALDWTIDATRGSAVVGIVSGLRDWQMPGTFNRGIAGPVAWAPPAPVEASVEELDGPVADLERVTPG